MADLTLKEKAAALIATELSRAAHNSDDPVEVWSSFSPKDANTVEVDNATVIIDGKKYEVSFGFEVIQRASTGGRP